MLAALGALALATSAFANTDGHDSGLHFSHLLFAESPSPGTKIRTDYIFRGEAGEDDVDTHTVRLEAEYAIRPWLGIEANIPFTWLQPETGGGVRSVDTIEVGLKLANFHFAERGLLLGGGIEFGLPTGNSDKAIGSDHIVEVEPFVDFGLSYGDLEVVGFLSPGIPINKNGEDEADVELGWDISFLYHFGDRVDVVLEFGGERVFGGEEGGESTATISPGVKWAPTSNEKLKIGAAVSIPMSDDNEFKIRTIVSVFWHF